MAGRGAADWEQVGRLASRQLGLITVAQLSRLGFGLQAVNRLASKGLLLPVRRSVYRLCGVAPTWPGMALAAVLAAGEGAALSHRGAAAAWGLVQPHDLEGRIDVTVPRQVRLIGVTAHRQPLLPGERITYRGLPVTSIERMLLDLGETETGADLGRLVDEAIRHRLTTVAKVARRVEVHASGGRRGLKSIRQALGERGVGYDPGANDWELGMDRMWDRMGLPAAERQYTIVLPGGRKYRPDRVIVGLRVTVDWNGYAWHGRRSDFERDIERRNLLTAAGWIPLEFHSNQSPRHICRTVLKVCAMRQAASLPAS